MRWLLQDFKSSQEGLLKLSAITDDLETGRTVKRCLKLFASKAHASDAIDLLIWIYGDAIQKYCGNIGQWYRLDAEQEGVLALMDVAKAFKPQQYAVRCIPKAFCKAVIRQIRDRRNNEIKQLQLRGKITDLLEQGFFLGENAFGRRDDSRCVTTTKRHDGAEQVVKLLMKSVANASDTVGLQPWVRSRLYHESPRGHPGIAQAGLAKTSALVRKRTSRFHAYLQRRFKDWRPQFVAVECLWLAGRNDDVVAISTLDDSAGDGGWGGRWEKRKT